MPGGYGGMSPGMVGAGLAAYGTYSRHKSFFEGTNDARKGASLGGDVGNILAQKAWGAEAGGSLRTGLKSMMTSEGRAVASGVVRSAAESVGEFGLKTAATMGLRAAIPAAAEAVGGAAAGEALGVAGGVAAGAVAGAEAGSIVPGVGTVIGATVGAVAPLVIPHIPVVGKAVNKIPIVGSILSPQHKKAKASGGSYSESTLNNPNLQTGSQYAGMNSANYTAGRGFRRGY